MCNEAEGIGMEILLRSHPLLEIIQWALYSLERVKIWEIEMPEMLLYHLEQEEGCEANQKLMVFII